MSDNHCLLMYVRKKELEQGDKMSRKCLLLIEAKKYRRKSTTLTQNIQFHATLILSRFTTDFNGTALYYTRGKSVLELWVTSFLPD